MESQAAWTYGRFYWRHYLFSNASSLLLRLGDVASKAKSNLQLPAGSPDATRCDVGPIPVTESGRRGPDHFVTGNSHCWGTGAVHAEAADRVLRPTLSLAVLPRAIPALHRHRMKPHICKVAVERTGYMTKY